MKNKDVRSNIGKTDCRSEEGLTVTLIDTISFLASQLIGRDLSSKVVQAAISDFRADERTFRFTYQVLLTKEEQANRAFINKTVKVLKKDKTKIRL